LSDMHACLSFAAQMALCASCTCGVKEKICAVLAMNNSAGRNLVIDTERRLDTHQFETITCIPSAMGCFIGTTKAKKEHLAFIP
jgi:hypothetical protein